MRENYQSVKILQNVHMKKSENTLIVLSEIHILSIE